MSFSSNSTTYSIPKRGQRCAPRGFLLLVVVVLLALMSLAALGSVALMQTEHTASRIRGDELQLENTVASAGELLAAVSRMSRQQRAAALSSANESSLFQHHALESTLDNLETPFFSVVSPGSTTEDTPEIRFGVVNESGKLHLQTLLEWDQKWPGSAERALLQLPGMSSSVADMILDWIDPDSMPRMQGAEQDKYVSERLPYSPRNAVPETLDELLLIPGVTRRDLFGDRSFGDSAEVDDDDSLSGDEHPPWSQFLTVVSRERNETINGQRRVYLNSPNLETLHQELSAGLGVDWANFVIAYRQFGPSHSSRGTPSVSFEPDFMIPANYEFESELDLIGSKVAISRSGRTPVLLNSPLSATRTGWVGVLSQLLDQVTVYDHQQIAGRINVELAEREVLMAIPEMDPATVDRILAGRMLGTELQAHPAWLLELGFVNLNRARSILPYLTTGGDVFQAEIVSYFIDRPGFLRHLVVIDGTEEQQHQLYWKDLRDRPMRFPIAALHTTEELE